MANNNEKFIFHVEAQTDRAIAKLQEVSRLMDQIERTKVKGEDDYNTTNQKDMDKAMRNISNITTEYRKLSREMQAMEIELRETMNSIYMPKSLTGNAAKQARQEIEQMKSLVGSYVNDTVTQQRALDGAYEKSLSTMRRLSTYQQNYSRNFKHIFSSNDIRNLPREYRTETTTGSDGQSIDKQVLDRRRARRIVDALTDDKEGSTGVLDNVQSQIREANKLERRSESASRRAAASNYMSHQQASNFAKDFQTSQQDYVKLREDNKESMVDLGFERTRLGKEIETIQSQEYTTQAERDKVVAMQRTIEAIDEEWDARDTLNETLERTTANLKAFDKQIREADDGKGAEVKPERGTFRGMVYERAPAIGLALGGAVGMAFGGLYSKGTQVNQSIRDDVISIGQRTGQDDWRENVRLQAMRAGMDDYLGLSGQEMLNFQNAYLSNRGFQDLDDLHTAMSSQAEFSRVTGLGAETTTQFFDQLFGSAKMTGDSVTDIQDAFVGAIERSGMKGREEDQLNALNSIVDSVGQGRTIGQEEVMNIMGLQSLLAQSGHESLRGATGGQMLTDLDQGIREGFNNPMARLLFGQGTEYQGLSGRWELRQQMEKGVSDVDNVSRLAQVASGYSSDEGIQNEALASLAYEAFGTNLTSEQAEGIMEMFRAGELTQENIDSVQTGDLQEGATLSEEALERYQGSREAIGEQSEAVTEYQSSRLSDLGDSVRKVNTAMGGLNPVIYGAIVALGALSVAALGTAASFGMSRGIRRAASGRYGQSRSGGVNRRSDRHRGGGGGGGGGGGYFWGGGGDGRRRRGGGGDPNTRTGRRQNRRGGRMRMGGRFGNLFNLASMGMATVGGWFDPSQRKGGLPNTGPSTPRGGRGGGVGNMFRTGAQGAQNLFGNALQGTKNFFGKGGRGEGLGNILQKGAQGAKNLFGGGRGGSGGPGILSKGMGGLSKVAGKAFMPLNIAMGVGSVLSAPKEEKGRAVGEATGGIGGALAGGAAGAAIGSAIPIVGTAVGGILGSIIGGMGGSSLGGWIGDKVQGAGGWLKDKASGAGEWLSEKAKGVGGWFKGLFGGGKDKEESSDMKGQVDRETTTNKARTEEKRGDNISDERTNLDRQENVIQEAKRVLHQARMQNGILGMSGSLASGAAIGGQSGSLRYLPDGTKWENAHNLSQSDLGYTDGRLTAQDLDKWIESKTSSNSLMRGMGEQFFQAGLESGLDPRYLIAHAGLETGWGSPTSGYAKDGNWFGIGAFDHNPDNAKNYGLGVTGGAKWIAENYYGKGHTTLDKMHKAGYATDPQWSSKIANIMGQAPTGTGTIRVDSTINVQVSGDESVASQVNNSRELRQTAENIQNRIYSSMSYHSQEMRRV